MIAWARRSASAFDVVAPPISSGTLKPWRVISSATVTATRVEGDAESVLWRAGRPRMTYFAD